MRVFLLCGNVLKLRVLVINFEFVRKLNRPIGTTSSYIEWLTRLKTIDQDLHFVGLWAKICALE